MKAVLLILATLVANELAGQCYDVRVALDGSGDYTSIQAAIENAPDDLSDQYIIFIAKGVYDEKLFIEKNHITLVGEDRDSTIITTAVLRRVWRENNPSDWGAATINVANDATDLTLAHLTVRNNFADVYPDFPQNNDHTFAIRGGGHRVIIIDCNVVATGGDTLSLWNTDGGMFYHNNCYFEGYVDYVAPRGYCYITESTFFGHNSTASIWHDGSGGIDHKFVIRNSLFTGVQGFALGRHHREAAFYLLDCFFDETMKNEEIYFTGSNDIQWGSRVYYHNCHRDFVNWRWYEDNLAEAAGSPEASEITPQWTFGDAWDPESDINGLLPYPFLPSPAIDESCWPLEGTLSWVPAMCTDSYAAYMIIDGKEQLIGVTDEPFIVQPTLQADRSYTWRVDAVSGGDTTRGREWTFRTEGMTGMPGRVEAPDPEDGADVFGNYIRLDWDYEVCEADSFYIYYGGNPDSLEFLEAVKYPPHFKYRDPSDSTYFWRVDTKGADTVTRGTVWSFNFNPSTTGFADPSIARDISMQILPNPFVESASIVADLAVPGRFSFKLITPDGRLVYTLPQEYYVKGQHTFHLDSSIGLIPGMYFCHAEFNGRSDTVQLIMLE